MRASVCARSCARRTATRIKAVLILIAGFSASAFAQTATSTFVPGTRDIFVMDFRNLGPGGLPRGVTVRSQYGSDYKDAAPDLVSVVTKDGVPMLKAVKPVDLKIQLAEELPKESFTIEFELIPKTGGGPADLAFEGTANVGRSATSMHVEWQTESVRAYGGCEGCDKQIANPLKDVVQGQPTKIAASFQGTTFQLFTNGQPLYDTPLEKRSFVHGRILRVSLGAQDGGMYAVHLSKLRIAAGGTAAVATQSATLSSPTNPLPVATPTTGTQQQTSSQPSTGTGSTPVPVVLATPTTTTATGMLASPPVIKGPEQTAAIFNFSPAFPPGVIVVWTLVPNATAYRIYRMNSASEPGVLHGTVTSSAAVNSFAAGALGTSTGAAVTDPEIGLSEVSKYQYWVQAVFADGKLSDPGTVVPVRVSSSATGWLAGMAPAPDSLTATVGGTTTVYTTSGETRGSKVTWTWNADVTKIPAYYFFATVETGSPGAMGFIGWTLNRSETIKAPGTPPIAYVTTSPGLPGPPYVLALPAGTFVRFCVAYFPVTDTQRQNNIGCTTSQLPP